MRNPGLPGLVLLALLGSWTLRAGAFLRIAAPASSTNLVRNADFETRQGTIFTAWSSAPNGYRVATGEGLGNTTALACEAFDTTGWRGASQSFTLNRTNTAPFRVRGWSRAENVSGNRDSDYSLYVDIIYTDGTPLWGSTATFNPGTHDWEEQQITIQPAKPVRSLSFYCIFRGHSGRVWFDDVSLDEWVPEVGAFSFQGATVKLANPLDLPPPVTAHKATQDGLKIAFADSWVTAVNLDGVDVTSALPGGFFARDVAANSDVYAFVNGQCPELGLGLQWRVDEKPDHLAIVGRITNRHAGDRAVQLIFALPAQESDWQWHDDIRRQRALTGSNEYANTLNADAGSTGTLSIYPVAAVGGARNGLALAIDMGTPALYRLFYHAATRQLGIAYDFGLATDTAQFPDAAEFRFVLFRLPGEGGFRSALDRLTRISPEHFRVRSQTQGLWMPFTDVATIPAWEEFGFRYHEGDNNVAWDDAHEVLSFRYLEPMTWWMPMSPELPRTLGEALRVRDAYAAGPAGFHRDLALVSRPAVMFGSDNGPALSFRNEPWANGAVWSLNPNPRLPASPNAATIYWNDAGRARYTTNQSVHLDGEYLDSIEGYVTANLNFRRDHFAFSSVPLTFATESKAVGLYKGLAIHEFTRWIADEVHARGGLIFANGVPYRFGYLCPWLDVLGTEFDWMPGGTYTPPTEAQLCLWRSLAGAKPYLLLLNTDFSRFTPVHVERYFQRSLAYGMFPSMFSANAAENPYWQNPTWYERDRPLFRKYIPMIRSVAEAGWKAVTQARFDATGCQVERFGPAPDGALYVTILNDSLQSRTGRLTVDDDPAGPTGLATELVTNQRLAWADGGWTLTVPGQSTSAIRLAPGPRIGSVRKLDGARLQISVNTPVGLMHVLELSTDLARWIPIATNTPTAPTLTFEVDGPTAADRAFLRLRWMR